MKLTCSFDKLYNSIEELKKVFDGAIQLTDLREIMIRISTTKFVSLYCLTQGITYRADLLGCEVEISDSELNERGEYLFVIPYSKFDKMLKTYKSSKVLCTSSITFESDIRNLKITVLEQEKDTYKVMKSTWVYMSGKLLPKIYERLGVNIERIGIYQELDTELFSNCLDKLIPVMSDTDISDYSRLFFSHDSIQALNLCFVATVENYLPNVFTDVTLTYSTIHILKNLSCKFNNVKCDRFDSYLYFVGDNFELRVPCTDGIKKRYDFQFEDDLPMFSIGGRYIENAVKRLKQVDDYKAVNLTIDFNNGKIEMSNGVFTQEMNALSAKGFGVLKLRLPVGAFDKSVLDKDAVIRFYFDISKRIMFITDADAEWISVALF